MLLLKAKRLKRLLQLQCSCFWTGPGMWPPQFSCLPASGLKELNTVILFLEAVVLSLASSLRSGLQQPNRCNVLQVPASWTSFLAFWLHFRLNASPTAVLSQPFFVVARNLPRFTSAYLACRSLLNSPPAAQQLVSCSVTLVMAFTACPERRCSSDLSFKKT